MRVAEKCKEVIGRHCWWLSDRSIPLALFSRAATDDDLSALAAAMLVAKETKEPVEPRKPDFPQLKANKKLHKFIGPESWILFDHLGELMDWLLKPPSEWDSDESFL